MSEYSEAKLLLIPSGVKEGKLYSQKPLDGTGDFTVDRNSTATRVNKYGIIETVGVDVPRIDHTDGGCGVLLVEPQSENLIKYSEDFSQWITVDGLITSNTSIAPDGTMTADKLDNYIVGGGDLLKSPTGINPANKTFVFSVWLKGSGDITIGITNGVDNSTSSRVSITNEFVRYSVTFTFNATLGDLNARFTSPNGSTNSFEMWGAQLEQQSAPTSYIPTQGTAVTRLDDVITVTPPVGVTEIIKTIDNVEQTPITVIPPTYQISEGNINKVVMN